MPNYDHQIIINESSHKLAKGTISTWRKIYHKGKYSDYLIVEHAKEMFITLRSKNFITMKLTMIISRTWLLLQHFEGTHFLENLARGRSFKKKIHDSNTDLTTMIVTNSINNQTWFLHKTVWAWEPFAKFQRYSSMYGWHWPLGNGIYMWMTTQNC